MLKSEIYNLAQIAVVTSPIVTPENKLEILRVLMNDEDVARYCEKKEAEKAAEEE